MWKNLKGKITKRECLFTLLMEDFEGNHGPFFDFFTVASPSMPSKGGKQKASETDSLDGKLVPLRHVVEAIPHCHRDIQKVCAYAEYIDPVGGQFSERVWKGTWGTKNDWEIWRALGMEKYGHQDVIETSST